MTNARSTAGWGMVILVLLAANLPLLAGHPNYALLFDGARVAAGEWWRVLTYPLAHVSIYHGLLDGSAFVVLWAVWRTPSWFRRMGMLLACSAGSLLGAMIWAPELWQTGLGGLSGVGHGLITVVALEQMRSAKADRGTWIGGLICLVTVGGKSVIEAGTGSVVFSSMHPGELGIPIAACHLGGVLGGLVASMWTEGMPWIHHHRAAPGYFA